MANHDIALNALFIGLRQRELEIVLASNCVLDWFGRTVTGRAKVINYYLNSNNCYEHSMSNAETIDAFEERSTHLSTREQPLDNFIKSPDLFADEQWYDCETHTPVDLKETLKTPPRTSSSTSQIKCPPAPSRRSYLNNSDDDDIVKHDSDSSSDIEDGIRPLDDTFELKEPKESEEPSNSKRQRRDNYDDIAKKSNNTKLAESIVEDESRYSGLYYIEATGIVNIRRQSPSTSRDECDRRECKMLISYRINKEVANDVQIALIVYKNLSSNVRSRRNLTMEFAESDDIAQELPSTPIASTFSTLPTSSRCRTVIKDRKQSNNNNNDSLISTAPCAGEKVTKATKRPIVSRNCLRF